MSTQDGFIKLVYLCTTCIFVYNLYILQRDPLTSIKSLIQTYTQRIYNNQHNFPQAFLSPLINRSNSPLPHSPPLLPQSPLLQIHQLLSNPTNPPSFPTHPLSPPRSKPLFRNHQQHSNPFPKRPSSRRQPSNPPCIIPKEFNKHYLFILFR